MSDRPDGPPLFKYYAGHKKSKGIISIPHSGEFIPEEFNNFLTQDHRAKMQDVDYKVNELIDIEQLRENGIHLIVSNIHRVAVDLNRAPELAVMNWKSNSHGVPLVLQEPSDDINKKLKAKYYDPYYEMLKTMIEEVSKSARKKVSVVDLHSMPSAPTAYHMKQNPNQKPSRPDFCVSDQNGLTCEPDFINFITKNLITKGHEALINDPYIGGFVTTWVNQFNTNNIQIEINRSIYMDEKRQELDQQKVSKLKPNLTAVLIDLFNQFV